MALYREYAGRQRNPWGVALKLKFAQSIANEFKGYQRILEIGPGDGDLALALQGSGHVYAGLEGSWEVQQNLVHRGIASVQHARVPPLPTNDIPYDGCAMLHVIEHMPTHADAERLLNNVRQQLRTGGRLIIATPDYYFWGDDFFNCDYSHSLPFCMRSLMQLVRDNGFTVKSISRYVGPLLGTKSVLLFLLARLLYVRCLDQLFFQPRGRFMWYRAFLTMLPNIILIGEKAPEEGNVD